MTMGVALASYGEIRFVILGVILQVSATVLESTRLILVQVLLQVEILSHLHPVWFLSQLDAVSYA